MRLFDPRDLHVGGSGSSDTDAVRPTGETGATCPWCGSEMRATMQAAKFIIGAQAKCTNSHCCARGPLVHDGTKEAALAAAAAARPLPDFPAGALQAVAQDRVETFDRRWVDVTAKMVEGELYLGLSESALVKEFVDFGHDILSRAPARPAAAGLTLTEEDRNKIQKSVMGHAYLPDARHPEYESFIIEKALDHVAVLLSSRATGAEVEIDETANAFIGSAASRILNHKRGFSHDDIVAVLEAHRIWLARRHATMRTGGGE